MSQDDLSLTKILYSVTRWSGKTTFFTFILTMILLAVTVNAADPNFDRVTLDSGGQSEINTFVIRSSERYQFVVFSDTEDEFTLYIQKLTVGSGIYSTLRAFKSTSLFKEVDLQPGTYRIVLESHADNNVLSMGYGGFNYALVGLTLLSVIVFSISMVIFFVTLPFTFTLLIINAANKQNKKPSTATTSNIKETRYEDPPVYKTAQPKRDHYTYNIFTDTFLANLTRNDWIMVVIGLFFVMLSFVEGETGVLVLGVILFVIAFYRVTEREKTKQRIIILLNRYPETTIGFIASHLDKRVHRVSKVLRYMILDDGVPILMDMSTGSVKVVGDLPDPMSMGNLVSRKPAPAINEAIQTTPINSQSQTSSFTETVSKPAKYHCTNCGTGFSEKVKFCYACGTKQ